MTSHAVSMHNAKPLALALWVSSNQIQKRTEFTKSCDAREIGIFLVQQFYTPFWTKVLWPPMRWRHVINGSKIKCCLLNNSRFSAVTPRGWLGLTNTLGMGKLWDNETNNRQMCHQGICSAVAKHWFQPEATSNQTLSILMTSSKPTRRCFFRPWPYFSW